jgi:serine protease AprX
MLNRMNLNFFIRAIRERKTSVFFPVAAVLLFQACLISFAPLNAQEETAPGKYRITFTDKNYSPFSTDRPEEFLSERALQRRQKQHIAIDSRDIPVNPDYIREIQSTGARILTCSKWLNSVTFDHTDSSALSKIMKLPYVYSVSRKINAPDQARQKKIFIEQPVANTELDYGNSALQIMMLNGDKLHAMGYTGENIHIAILDGGFYNADTDEAFDRLWQENRILGVYDFVNPGGSVFQENYHGKTVLSIIGGYVPGYLIGTAPDASFYLLRSEDVGSEYPIEEDNWIAAAEYADSSGADIINTSLGYSTFDDPSLDYNYADMDGNSTRISTAADIAASRGMLVVVSVGNEGSKSWRYITAPSDADSVLAVGAVNSSLSIAHFSGHGPSSDGQVKPDVCAMGVSGRLIQKRVRWMC